ncbi:hypothetical protein VTP01DRAFT_5197 [Rhizomucor pusillus]|uniref:uncharacterized protein n=1 Tax=Rhizomucor pusillus TaxID=4840 RepID=UPI0037428906
MDRKEQPNPSDHDDAPPSYEQSTNTAYNPAFVPPQDSSSPHLQQSYTPPLSPPHTADTSQPSPFLAASAPSLPQLQDSSSSEQQQQQQQRLYPSVQQHPSQPDNYNSQYYYYQSINIPSPRPAVYSQQPLIYRRSHRYTTDRSFPIAALFFLFGWFCPPLWVLGACCCSGSRNPYESWWGKVNFIMAVMFILSSIIYSMIAITVGDWTVGLRVLNVYTR